MHTLTMWCRLKDEQRSDEFLVSLYHYMNALRTARQIEGFRVVRPPKGRELPGQGEAEIGITLWAADKQRLLGAGESQPDAALENLRVPVFSFLNAVQYEEPA